MYQIENYFMNLINQQLEKIKKEKRIGLMTHVVVGYPSLQETIEIVKTMAASGVDFVELQIPFSDPLADGPTIMQACEASLRHGTKVKDAFTVMKELSSQVSIPLLFMGYYNTVFKYGVERFCNDAKTVGASGLIIPDMPVDEEGQEHFYKTCKKFGLYTILVISPASTDERLQKNAPYASGFVYCTSRQGTTGATSQLADGLAMYLKKVKKYISVPLAVGFGISKKGHIHALQGHADIAVIGSALIEVVDKSSEKERMKNIAAFLSNMIK